VLDDFKQRMKALWKSLLFRVVAGQTKSANDTVKCVQLAVYNSST
jgi:hypothetical protein